MSFVKTQVFSDTCNHPVGTPLPTASYTIVGGPPNDDVPEYSGRRSICTTINHLGDGMASMVPALNADQYIQATVAEWSINSQWSVIWLYVRAGVQLTPSYAMFVANENGGTGGFWNFIQYDANSAIVYEWFVEDQPVSNVFGSAFTLGVVQPKHNGVASGHPVLVAQQNGVVLGTGDLTLSPGGIIPSGRAGFQIDSLDGNLNHGTSIYETAIGPVSIGNFADNI